MRTYIIYAPETDCSLRVLACASHETAVAADELAVYATNSLENFVRISCSHQKVVRLFQKWYDFSESGTTFQKVLPLFPISAVPTAVLAIAVRKSYHFFPYQLFPSPYQLFPSPYQLFPSQGTPIPRTRTASSFSSMAP